MKKKEEKNTFIEMCPVRNIVARFGNKWAILIILDINEKGVARFNELCKMIPDVSPRVLSGTLKTLEADDIIARKIYPVVPPKVEYRLTDVGKSLLPLIAQLTEWAENHMKTIVKHRNKFTNV